MHFERFKG